MRQTTTVMLLRNFHHHRIVEQKFGLYTPHPPSIPQLCTVRCAERALGKLVKPQEFSLFESVENPLHTVLPWSLLYKIIIWYIELSFFYSLSINLFILLAHFCVSLCCATLKIAIFYGKKKADCARCIEVKVSSNFALLVLSQKSQSRKGFTSSLLFCAHCWRFCSTTAKHRN